MNEKQVKAFFEGFSIPKVCKCGSRSFSLEEVEKCLIDFSNGYFEPLFPLYIIKCRICKKETRIKT